jgi:hypothetical protein
MQAERVEICSARLMSKGVSASWLVPLNSDASADDVLACFAQFLLDGSTVPQYPILQNCFTTLTTSKEECMFVFMRRGANEAVGILRSNKPLCSPKEQSLLKQVGLSSRWNVPLWTWKESHPRLTESMEFQCRTIKGPCFGIWCYR